MAKQRTDTESVLKLVINGQQAKASTKELQETFLKLNAEINNMKKADDPRAYAEKAAQVQKLKSAWSEARNEINGTTKSVKGFNASFADIAKGVFGGAMLTRAWDMAVQGVNTFITKNAELSDEMAGVSKTTGLTEAAVDRLNEKFKKFDTRTAKSELLGLAQVAGKLGYSAEADVEGFVRAADKIGVALGEDLGGTEEAINNIGKLVDIFKITDTFGLEESLLKVGSAINELGASGSAKESYLIDFTQRLAGIAPAADISMTDVLGLAATLDELGQGVEASSTAVGQFIVQMGNDVPRFAKIAGMALGDFTKLLKEDANEAFLRVLENSNSAGGGIQKLAENMGLLEVAGARGIASLGALSGNVDKLREKQEIASASFEEGTSIVSEFDKVNTNLAANLEKLSNRMAALWEKSKMRTWLTNVTGSMLEMSSETDKSAIAYQKQKQAVEESERALNPLITRYEELKGKNELSNDEHVEFRDLIQKIGELMPGVIEEFDKYGNVIDINIGKVHELTKAQRELLQIREKDRIKSLENTVKENYALAQQRSAEANSSINGGRVYETLMFGLRGPLKTVERLGDESKLALGGAYDAAKELRDVFGLQLSPEIQKVIDQFEKIETPGKKKAQTDAEKEAERIKAEEEAARKKAALEEEKKAEAGRKKSAAQAAADEKRRIQEIKSDKEKLSEFIRKNSDDLLHDTLQGTEKEMAIIHAKYDEKRKLAHNDIALLEQLADQENREIEQLIDKVEEELTRKAIEGDNKRMQIQQQVFEAGLGVYELEIEREKQKYDELIQLAEAYGFDITALIAAREAKLLAIETAHKDEGFKKEEERIQEIRDMAIESAQLVSDTVFQMGENNRRAKFDQQHDDLQRERDRELSNKNLTEAQKTAIEEKYDQKTRALKREEFKADQRAALAQAVINMALGIGKAIPNPVKMAFASASGLAQIAVIASQKAPQYAKGGLLPAGSSHAQGGIDLWDKRRNAIIGNIEGGEPILSRATYANNRQIVDELLYSSQRKAGARIRLNPEILDAERMVRNGGYSRGSAAAPVVNVSSPGTDTSSLERLMHQMILAQREANDKEVILSTRVLDQDNAKKAKLKNSINA